MNSYQELIYKRTYSRYLPDEGRRETWNETVERYMHYMLERVPPRKKAEFKYACEGIKKLEVMPSMRSLWTAGPALERDNIAGYNCAYTVIDSPRIFAEILYILLNGTGVGFSVERQYINKLPEVPEFKDEIGTKIVFGDSKLGWAEGYNRLIKNLWKGITPECDYSKVRAKGERLKTFGGKASGPEPLMQLVDFTVQTFKNAQGRKLNSLEVHNIACMIANIVVVGGVRRSACISLSNLSDKRLAHAKDGEFWKTAPHLALANNSICYTEKPDAGAFMEEWLNLYQSKSGVRCIFNRESAKFIAAQSGRRDTDYDFGCNPCSEILLRPNELCNLSECVVRPDDTLEDLKKKVRMATIIGTVQSTLTKFNFVSRKWKKNCEEERLLGVSLTGLRDHPVLGHKCHDAKMMLAAMKEEAIATAEEWSEALEINCPTAITCVKPSGTVSQLVDSASGLHPRYAPHYIRRVQVATMDSVCQLLKDQGVPWNPCVGEDPDNPNNVTFEFPMASPQHAVMRDEVTALEQLEYWLMIQQYWCEHKPSITVYVKEHEWPEVGAWVYRNWNYVSGISFLPYDNGCYTLAPYEEITESVYKSTPKIKINFDKLSDYETEDETTGSQELACTGGACELS